MAGLLLAAGGGSRLGMAKALLTVEDEPLFDRAVRALREAGCAPIVAVLGAAADEVPDRPGVRRVVNADWPAGMGGSLRRGLAALAETPAQACVILLVDTPGIGVAAVHRVVAAAEPGRSATGWGVATASYSGRRGHPVVIGRQHWAEVARLAEGDVGARPFFAAHPELVRAVPCDDVARPDDLDTPEAVADYVRWRHGQ